VRACVFLLGSMHASRAAGRFTAPAPALLSH